MAENFPTPVHNHPRRPNLPVSPRLLAILLMIAGAVSFVLARLLFGDQVLCLLGSTLVTFVGLGLIIAGRRNNWEQYGPQGSTRSSEQGSGSYYSPQNRSRRAGSLPRGLRSAARQRQTPTTRQSEALPPETRSQAQPRAVSSFPSQRRQTTGEPPESRRLSALDDTAPLLGQVLAYLQANGAQVSIRTRRDDRAVLAVTGSDAQNYTFLVNEDTEPVDVAEIRGLNALVNTSGSAGGFLITAGSFTQKAYEWADQRHIRLVTADELDEINL